MLPRLRRRGPPPLRRSRRHRSTRPRDRRRRERNRSWRFSASWHRQPPPKETKMKKLSINDVIFQIRVKRSTSNGFALNEVPQMDKIRAS